MIGKILVIGGTGLALGLVASHFGLFESPGARRVRRDVFRRVPLPHIALHLPTSQVEFDGLDDALCECALSQGAAQGMSHPELLALADPVRTCAGSLLFPDVDWPPVLHDNPTIHQYWAVLDQRFRRLVYSGEITQFCGLGAVVAAPIVTDLAPRSVAVGTKPLVTVSGTLSPATTARFLSSGGTELGVEIRERTQDFLQLIVDADEPGSYDLLVSSGPNPASSNHYPGAFVVAPTKQE